MFQIKSEVKVTKHKSSFEQCYGQNHEFHLSLKKLYTKSLLADHGLEPILKVG